MDFREDPYDVREPDSEEIEAMLAAELECRAVHGPNAWEEYCDGLGDRASRAQRRAALLLACASSR
jgi:hypothetical protein